MILKSNFLYHFNTLDPVSVKDIENHSIIMLLCSAPFSFVLKKMNCSTIYFLDRNKRISNAVKNMIKCRLNCMQNAKR